MRILRALRWLLEAALVAWSTYQLLALALEWWRSDQDPRDSVDTGAGAYPNEWGVRLEPLSELELVGALELERALVAESTDALVATRGVASPLEGPANADRARIGVNGMNETALLRAYGVDPAAVATTGEHQPAPPRTCYRSHGAIGTPAHRWTPACEWPANDIAELAELEPLVALAMDGDR